jgi:hypothetical protein
VVGASYLRQTSNLERLSSWSAVVSVHPVHGTEEARIVLLDTSAGGRTNLAQEGAILFMRQFAASDNNVNSVAPGIAVLHVEHQVQLPVDGPEHQQDRETGLRAFVPSPSQRIPHPSIADCLQQPRVVYDVGWGFHAQLLNVSN